MQDNGIEYRIHVRIMTFLSLNIALIFKVYFMKHEKTEVLYRDSLLH